MNWDGHKFAIASVVSSASGIAMESATHLQDVTQTGQIFSIIVSIVSGIVSLYKLLKRKK